MGTSLMHSMSLAPENLALAQEAHWYALRTRSRHEKLVTVQLENQGIQAFLPVVSQVHQWSDRKKQVELPLFSGYTFARLVQSSDERFRALKTYGVVGFVGVHGTGTPIPQSQIEDIRILLAQKIAVKNHTFLRVGQRVRIRGGSLDGVEGILVAVNGSRSLVISLEPIQRSLSISIEGYGVEPV